MQVAIFKQYDGTVCMMVPTQEFLDLGNTVQETGIKDIPAALNVPQVASSKQSLVKAYDRPDATNTNVQRYNFVTEQWENLLDGSGAVIPVTGTITHNHNFLVMNQSALPSDRFFTAWEIQDSQLTSGAGTASHPPFFTS